jgi:hypothetical protein
MSCNNSEKDQSPTTWSSIDLKEKSLNFTLVSEELKQLLLMLAEDIQDMRQDILQLKDLLSLRPTSTTCSKDQDKLPDHHQSTDKGSIWRDLETINHLGSKWIFVIN